MLGSAPEQHGTSQCPCCSDANDQHKTRRPGPVVEYRRAGDNQQREDKKRIPHQWRDNFCPPCDKKDFVISRKFFFAQRRGSVRSVDDASTPFGYFPAEHADEIAVQLNCIDYVEGQKQQTDSSQAKHDSVKVKSHRATRRREWLRRQLEKGECENPIKGKKNSN